MPKRKIGMLTRAAKALYPFTAYGGARYTGTKGQKRRRSGYYGYGTKESKFFDTTFGSASTATGGTFTTLTLIPQGLTESTRIGRQILITSVAIKGLCQINASVSENGTSDVVRIVLVQDKQTNGAIAGSTEYLELNEINGFNNLSNKNRFKTLASMIVHINTPLSGDGTTTQTGEAIRYFQLFKKVKIPMEFAAGTGAITEISSNSVLAFVISEEATANIRWETRIRYTG